MGIIIKIRMKKLGNVLFLFGKIVGKILIMAVILSLDFINIQKITAKAISHNSKTTK